MSAYNTKRQSFVISPVHLNRSIKEDPYTVHINKDSKILIDATPAVFSDLEQLEGKYISVACLADSDTVTVWTCPAIRKGTIESVKETATFKTITIILENGIKLEYIIDSETEIAGNPKPGDKCEFFADGLTMEELK